MAFSVGLRPTSPLSSVARRGAPWPWKVWRFAPARSVFCGRGRFGPSGLHAPFSVLRSPGRPCRPSPFSKAWRAKPAMPYRPPGRACALSARTARPSVVLCVLCVLCDFQNNLAVLRAPARQNLHQSAGSAFSILAVLRVPSWFFVLFVSAPQGTPSTPLPAPPSLWKTRGPTQKHFAERPVFAKLKV